MPEIIKFKVFCIERYKFAHELRGSEVVRLFKEYGVLDYIAAFFDVLHAYGDRYLVADIDEYIAHRRQKQA